MNYENNILLSVQNVGQVSHENLRKKNIKNLNPDCLRQYVSKITNINVTILFTLSVCELLAFIHLCNATNKYI